jgi:hypothetical protein
MTFRVLDPHAEKAPPAGQLAPRLNTLEGKTIGFISNGKEGTKGFFGHLDRLLREEHGCGQGGDAHQVQLQRAGRRPHRRRDQELGCGDLRHRRLRQLFIVQSARLRNS